MDSRRPGVHRRAVIVGAGIGGLALSIYLARQGYVVEVFEKQGAPGGRCGAVVREGHRFDLGATMLLMPRLVESIFRDWGERAGEHLDLKPLDPLYRFHFADGGHLDMSTDLKVLASQMEALERGSFERWLGLLALGCRQYERIMRALAVNYRRPGDYFSPRNVGSFLRSKAYRSYSGMLRRHVRHPRLQAMFSFPTLYVGQNPFASSAAFLMLPALGLKHGGWHPVGGMHQIAASLAALAARHDVTVHLNAPVEGIECRDGRAIAVRLEDGSRVPADVVISNADLPYTYRRLLGDRRVSARLERMRYTCSAVVFHWALDRAYPQLGHHGVFLGDDYRGGLDGIFERGGIADDPHFYVNRPTHSDPAAAPPGQDSITVIVPAWHRDGRFDQDWGILVRRARSAVLSRLGRIGAADVERHLKFEVIHDPVTWERDLNLSRGALFGSLDHRATQMGCLRPANRHARLPNLFFVGGSTHPGSAVPLALLSARLTAERVLGAEGRDHLPWGELEF